MSARTTWSWLGLCVGLQVLLACSFDAGVNDAHGCDERCARCELGYCLMTIEEGVSAGGSSGSAGSAGSAGAAGSAGFAGAAGSAGAAGAGATGGSGGSPSEGCAGQAAPAPEACNALDDDCDGAIDESLELGSCSASGPGMCTSGTLRCEQGEPVCHVAAEPSAEVCNGLDDDCDASVDEDTELQCYPSGIEGCVANADGSFECVGSCAAGTQTCVGGELSACSGAITPQAEACGGDEAADENCNGSVDDGCPCEGDETQRCYSGPALTAGVGICRAGTQTCKNGLFGPCEGAVTPGTESCANEGSDDDCDRRRDDISGRGGLCFDFRRQGACFFGTRECDGGALVCETTPAAPTETACDLVDEDCDGRTDETFALATDEQNCGGCDVRCSAGQQCCGGTCRTISSDAANCGGCNVACTSGSACCGGTCTPTNTDAHCGSCTMACSDNQDCCGSSCTNIRSTMNCGGCGITCTAGQGCCETGCADLNTVAHCGACDIACSAGQNCCNGLCVTPGTEDAHCGACGIACPEACTCQAGECRDAMGLACL